MSDIRKDDMVTEELNKATKMAIHIGAMIAIKVIDEALESKSAIDKADMTIIERVIDLKVSEFEL